MKIKSLVDAKEKMSEALTKKTDETMCLQKHSEISKDMGELKAGNINIADKLDGLKDILLTGKFKEG